MDLPSTGGWQSRYQRFTTEYPACQKQLKVCPLNLLFGLAPEILCDANPSHNGGHCVPVDIVLAVRRREPQPQGVEMSRSKEPTARVVLNNDEGVAAFAANVQRAGNGLIAAESWDELRDQVPSVLAEAVRSIRDGLRGMDLWDVLEVLRQLTAHGDLGEFRESLNTSLPAVVEVVALIGLANDSDLEPPVNNVSAGQNGPAIPQILEAAERIVRLAQLVAISSSSDTHLGRTAELTGLLRTFEVTVRGRNYLSISRQIVQSIFGPAPIRDLTSRHASFTPDDVSGLWDAIQKCRQERHEGNIARFENLVEVTEAGVSLSPDQILEGRTLFESLFAAPGQGISFTAAELATLSGLATNIVKDILNCFSLDSVPVSAYEACKKFVHGENLLSGKGMLRRADSYLAIGDPKRAYAKCQGLW